MAPRTILYTGKGGVGKPSVAACTARTCAAQGLKTLIVSTDPAHSLSDSLETDLGSDPTTVATNLEAAEIDAQHELSRHWKGVQDWFGDLLMQRGRLCPGCPQEFACSMACLFPSEPDLFTLRTSSGPLNIGTL